MAKKKISYQKAMKELKSIVAQLQKEAISIDDLSAKTKRAAELILYCKKKLRTTEEELAGLFEEE